MMLRTLSKLFRGKRWFGASTPCRGARRRDRFHPSLERLERREVPSANPWLDHTGTPLDQTGSNWQFIMADWNHDGIPDLVAIKQSQTCTASTEVHILDGRTFFQTWLLHTGTALGETGSNWQFAMADWNHDGIPDLVAIKQSQTGTSSTEVHILNGSTFFQNYLFET